MSATEVGWRIRALAIQQAWRLGTGNSGAVAPGGWSGAALRPSGTADPAASAQLLAAAEAILTGRWAVFGDNFDTAPEDPDWHRDIRTGIRFDPARYCFDVPFRRPELVGNLKALWEPSRLHHVTVLASAYHSSGDERFARQAAAHLRSWWRRNPPLRGIHWISGIELGMRLIAWVWTRRLLSAWPGVETLFERNPEFMRQLHQHERWLTALHSRGSSANNHLIAEAAGLFIATTAFSGTPRRKAMAQHAAEILEREAQAQTFPDGLNRELAFGYHGYVLALMLLAAVEGESGGRKLSVDYWRVMTRMADALAANLVPGEDGVLQPSRQGDGDDAAALVVDAPQAGAWSPLLDLCGSVFGRLDWWPHPQEPSLLSALVAPLAHGRRATEARPARRPDRFAPAGITFLRGQTDPAEAIACRVDHGPHGYLATCAHGHADALGFELWIGGHPVLVDPGTYCYQGEPEWRRFFRSTIAHNTLEIAGLDQAVQAGPFLWSTRPRSWIEAESGIEAGDHAELTIAHDGYRRLEAKATHFRRYRLDRVAGSLGITDWIDAATPVPVRLAFHFAPAVQVRLHDARAELAFAGRSASLGLPASLAWRIHRGEQHPPLGWYSPEFGEKVPCVTLVGSGTLTAGIQLESRLRVGAGGSDAPEASAPGEQEVGA
jgi:hypothetical protein